MTEKENNNGCLWMFVAVLVIWDVIKSICAARIIAKGGWEAYAHSGWMTVTYVMLALALAIIAIALVAVVVVWINDKRKKKNDNGSGTVL